MSFILLALMSALYLFYSRAVNTKLNAGEDLPPMRRLSYMDGIEESVGRAAETNRPFAVCPSAIDRGVRASITLSNYAMTFYVARLCARTGAKFLTYPIAEGAINMSRQYVIDAYTAEGKLDEYDETYNMRWIQGKNCGSRDVRTVHSMWEENISAVAFIGSSWCYHQQLGTQMPIIGATVLMGDGWPMGSMFCAVMGDYTLLGEEAGAFAAYLTGDPIQVAGVYAEDAIKYFLLPLMLVTWLLQAAGNNSLWDFLGT
jgi:hypothetical protein